MCVYIYVYVDIALWGLVGSSLSLIYTNYCIVDSKTCLIPAMPVTPFEKHEHAMKECPPHHEEDFAGICHLLDRKEWGKHAGAQECVDGEANGLVANCTWNYEDVVPRKELLERKTPNMGRLMTPFELSESKADSLHR